MATYEPTSTDPTRNRTVTGSEVHIGTDTGKTEQAKEKVARKGHEFKEQAAETARTKLDEGKHYGERNLESTARALRETADNLKEEDQDAMARYTEWAAGQVDSVANYFRERSVDDVFQDVRYMARKNPGVVLGGALMAGFMAARFLKASDPLKSDIRTNQRDYGRPRRSDYGRPTDFGSPVHTSPAHAYGKNY